MKYKLFSFGYEWKTRRSLFGIPLVHVALGWDKKSGKPLIAKGIIAVGQFAVGVIAVGQFAVGGVFCLAQFAVGAIAIAQFALGFLFGLGQFATGVYAAGQFAAGKFILNKCIYDLFLNGF